MAILVSHLCVIGVAMILFGQMEGFQAVSNNSANVSEVDVSRQEGRRGNADNMVSVVFVNSCNGAELNYSIANIRGGCYNIATSHVKQVIKTEPGDVKLFLYDEFGCTGNEIEYLSSGQLNVNLPFLPVSFAIARR